MPIFPRVCWVVAAIYATIPCFWIAVHGHIDRWRGSGARAYLPLLGIWGAFILIALTVTYRMRAALLYRATILSWSIALLCWILALSIYRQIPRFGVGRFVGRNELRGAGPHAKLVVSGMHAYVRHPIYLGHLLTLSAWCIVAGSGACLLLWIFAVISGAAMLRSEEHELLARFGDGYRDYRRRTPMLLPRSARIFGLPS